MINYQKFKENYISRRNMDLDFHVLTDMAIENDDPNILLIPVLKKITSLKSYLHVINSKISPRTNYYFTNLLTSPHKKNPLVRQAKMNKFLGIKSAATSYVDAGHDSYELSIMRPFLDDIYSLIEKTYSLLKMATEKQYDREHYYKTINDIDNNNPLSALIHSTIEEIKKIDRYKENNFEFYKKLRLVNDDVFEKIISIIKFFKSLKTFLEILKNHFEVSFGNFSQKRSSYFNNWQVIDHD